MVRVVGCHLQKGPEESKGSWLWSWWLVVTWKKDLRKGLGFFFKIFGQGSPGTNSPSVSPSVVALTHASLAAQSFFRHRSFLVSLPSLSPSVSPSPTLSLSLSSCLHASQRKRRRKFALFYNRTTISLLTPVEKFALFGSFFGWLLQLLKLLRSRFCFTFPPPEFVFLHGVTPLQELFFGSPLPSLSLFRVPICD